MNDTMLYTIGEKLYLRLLGYATSYSVVGVIRGIVDYTTAEAAASVDEQYYNLKSSLSEEVFADRVNKLFYRVEVEDPLVSPFKVGQSVYVSADLYDANLTTKAIEIAKYTFSFTVNKSISGNDDTTLESLLDEIKTLISTKGGVTMDIVENDVEESLIDSAAEKMRWMEAQIADMKSVDTDAMKLFSKVPLNDLVVKLNKVATDIADAAGAVASFK